MKKNLLFLPNGNIFNMHQSSTYTNFVFTSGAYHSLAGYELSNHLGNNVLTTISDKKLPIEDSENPGEVEYYAADVLNVNDYYPFGMLQPGRSWSAGSSYRYGFNTQEKMDELKGEGNHYTAKYWEYDPRVVQRWNMDPKSHPSFSPYDINRGNPILYTDILGDSIDFRPAMSFDNASGTNYTQNIINDLQEQTGLNLSTNSTGKLIYDKDKDGNPVTAKDSDGNSIGSDYARQLIINAIEDTEIVTVFMTPDRRTRTDRAQSLIGVDPNQIQTFIEGKSQGLNPKTMGFGMVFMHGITHTNIGGATVDPPRGSPFGATGATVDRMNIIRSELGLNYGQRLSYPSKLTITGAYLPFSIQSKRLLENGIIPVGILQSPHVKIQE